MITLIIRDLFDFNKEWISLQFTHLKKTALGIVGELMSR